MRRSNVRTSLRSAVWKEGAWRAGSAGAVKGIGLVLVAAAFLAVATDASAETITTEEPVVLANGETALEVTELTADAVTTVAGTTIRCKKVHGWHGLKHPLFGYFYWKYILTIRWCWEAGGSLIVKTTNPWSPTYWREVECCMQFSGWDFVGHMSLDIDGGVERSMYRVRAQGKFKQCYQFCFNTKTPFVRLTGYPGGSWGFAHGN
jgi:hypothetical protein